MKPSPIRELIKEEILIIDGAMGTMIQKASIDDNLWQGNEGCNELLNVTAPEIIKDIHSQYLKAGANLIKTNTFGSFTWVLDEYNLGNRSYEITYAGVKLCKEACLEYSTKDRPRFVLGSIGPGTKLPSLGHIDYDTMYSGYSLMAQAMIDAGVDAFLLETCQDPLQIKTALHAFQDTASKNNVDIPIMVSVTIELSGTMLIGTDPITIANILEPFDILTLGFNCGTGPIEIKKHLQTLSLSWNGRISIHANAGLPQNIGGKTHYPMGSDEFAFLESAFLNFKGLSAFGGCCGTTPAHIEALYNALKDKKPSTTDITPTPAISSLFLTKDLFQTPPPFLIGERSNATGSKAFRDILLAENYEGTLSVAQQQVKSGAHGIDVSVGFAGRDETKDMKEIISIYNQKIQLPLMVDTTQINALEVALKLIGSRAIINSVNLEDGLERFDKICSLAKRYGASLVCLTIDEDGMAKTAQKKFEIADKLISLAKQRHNLREEDLVVDTLTFTVGSGDDEFRNAAVETINAIRQIREKYPKTGAVLGVSNISFGLDKDAREYLNSVFLHHCIDAGLTMAIINVKNIMPLAKMEPIDIQICEDLLFNNQTNSDPLFKFIAHFSNAKDKKAKSAEEVLLLPTDERIKLMLIDGDKEGMLNFLPQAKDEIEAETIINEILISAMKEVGELFGKGEMQLPFVLQSAEVMKAAVDFLNPFLPKIEKKAQTRLVLGTVKGDVHDVGKNLVDIILSNNGFLVENIGIKADLDNFLKAYDSGNVAAFGMSGLLVKSTQVMMDNLIELKNRGITIPILLGGAALTKSFIEDYCRPNYDGPIFYCRDAFDGITAMSRIEKGDFNTNLSNFDDSNIEVATKKTKEIQEIPFENVEMPTKNQTILTPPFWGRKHFTNWPKETAFSWINHKGMFSRSWGFKTKGLTQEEIEKQQKEVILPTYERLKKLFIEELFEPTIIYGYWPCIAENNKLYILDPQSTNENTERKIIKEFNFPRQQKLPHRALSDYYSSDKVDVLPMFVVSCGRKITEYEQELYKNGEFKEYLLVHGLGVELAEALAELVHKQIRIDLNICHKEAPYLSDVKMSHYQGKRYAFGYPACPDMEPSVDLFELLKPEEFGITLTENYQMVPEQSTSALVVHHNEAIYYSI